MKWMRCVLLVFSCMSTAFALPLQKIVVFGDSLSDTGNLYDAMWQQLPLSPPYFKGRFSDGPVWVEWLPKYLAKDEKAFEVENYAFGGAVVLDDGGVEFEGAYLTLTSQVDAYFLKHKDKLTHDGVLYIILMGGNDYIAPEEQTTARVDAVVSKISAEAARLAADGAKFILVGNVPDLGKSPLAREQELEVLLSDISSQHNLKLLQRVDVLKQSYPKTDWLFFDIHQFFMDAVSHPEKYDFEYASEPCIHLDGESLMKSSVMQLAAHPGLLYQTQLNCDKYLFFDAAHPTRRGHEIAASLAVDLIQSHLKDKA